MFVLAMAAVGCVAPEPAIDDEVAGDDTAWDAPAGAAITAAAPAASLGCRGVNPTSGAFFTCYYDAAELQYSDGWKCTPPGDVTSGRCKTTTVGKKVSFTFRANTGVFLHWRPSNAQGSARVVIDGVDRGLVWQGEDSEGDAAFPLAAGLHRLELIKPARDGDRAIVIHSIGNTFVPPPP